MSPRPSARLGHRGALLFWVGAAWLLEGARVLRYDVAPWPRLEFRAPGSEIYEAVLGSSWVLWTACGLLAIVAAFFQRSHPRMDRLGYAAAVAPAAMTAVLWVGNVLRLAFPGTFLQAPDVTLEQAVMAAVFWIAATGLFYTAAGWPEPEYPPDEEGGDHPRGADS